LLVRLRADPINSDIVLYVHWKYVGMPPIFCSESKQLCSVTLGSLQNSMLPLLKHEVGEERVGRKEDWHDLFGPMRDGGASKLHAWIASSAFMCCIITPL